MANNNKPWHEWISTIAQICTILGFSIFRGKSILGDNQTDATSIGGKKSSSQYYKGIIHDKSIAAIFAIAIVAIIFIILGINILGDNQTSQYHKGIIHDKSWESKFIGLRYTAPKGMSMFTEEELDGLMELDWENLSKNFSQYQLGAAKLTTVYEMLCKANDQSTTVGVCVEKLIDEMNVSQFVEIFESQLAQVYTINYTIISDDETVKIGNEYYIKVSYIMESNNVFLYLDNYFRVVGDRVIMIGLAFDNEIARDNVLSAFTVY